MHQSKGVGIIEPDYLAHRQNEALDALEKGEIEQICVNAARPVDQIVMFGLRSGFLQSALRFFPDPRKNFPELGKLRISRRLHT